MLRVVNPSGYETVIADLNYLGRKRVRLLREKDLPITAEAQQLLNDFHEEEVLYLGRDLSRSKPQRTKRHPLPRQENRRAARKRRK